VFLAILDMKCADVLHAVEKPGIVYGARHCV
jgi:hypothetical protein